ELSRWLWTRTLKNCSSRSSIHRKSRSIERWLPEMKDHCAGWKVKVRVYRIRTVLPSIRRTNFCSLTTGATSATTRLRERADSNRHRLLFIHSRLVETRHPCESSRGRKH